MYDELVKRLRSVKDSWQSEEESWMLQAADAIEELSMVCDNLNFLNKRLWIPVTERLPEEYETVLFVTRAGEVIVGFYDSEHNSYCDMTGFRKLCTHWMPLPEPPKEDA